MMDKLVAGVLVLVGVIHLLPVSGVLGVDRLAALYGVALEEPNLEILMRHRAVLFGLLGVFLIYAAFEPTMRWIAIIAGLVSVVSFVVLARTVGDCNAAVGRVVVVDVAAAALLVVAGVLQGIQHGPH